MFNFCASNGKGWLNDYMTGHFVQVFTGGVEVQNFRGYGRGKNLCLFTEV